MLRGCAPSCCVKGCGARSWRADPVFLSIRSVGGESVRAERCQVHLLLAGGAKGGDSLGRIIRATIETAIYQTLKPMAQWMKEHRNGKGRDHHDDGRLLRWS